MRGSIGTSPHTILERPNLEDGTTLKEEPAGGPDHAGGIGRGSAPEPSSSTSWPVRASLRPTWEPVEDRGSEFPGQSPRHRWARVRIPRLPGRDQVSGHHQPCRPFASSLPDTRVPRHCGSLSRGTPCLDQPELRLSPSQDRRCRVHSWQSAPPNPRFSPRSPQPCQVRDWGLYAWVSSGTGAQTKQTRASRRARQMQASRRTPVVRPTSVRVSTLQEHINSTEDER